MTARRAPDLPRTGTIGRTMSTKKQALTALLVLPLAFAAGYLGSLLHAPAAVPAGRTTGASDLALVRDRIEELDRRVANLEGNLTTVRDTAEEALRRADENAIRLERLETGGGVSPPKTPDGDSADKRLEDEIATDPESLRDQMLRRAVRVNRGLLHHELGLYADGTPGGEANRKAQAYADAQRMGSVLRLDDEHAADLRVDHHPRRVVDRRRRSAREQRFAHELADRDADRALLTRIDAPSANSRDVCARSRSRWVTSPTSFRPFTTGMCRMRSSSTIWLASLKL